MALGRTLLSSVFMVAHARLYIAVYTPILDSIYHHRHNEALHTFNLERKLSKNRLLALLEPNRCRNRSFRKLFELQDHAVMRQTLGKLRTDGYAGYSLAYSPFFPQLVAVASSSNFGLVGNGRLHIANPNKQGLGDKKCVCCLLHHPLFPFDSVWLRSS